MLACVLASVSVGVCVCVGHVSYCECTFLHTDTSDAVHLLAPQFLITESEREF